MENKSPLVIKRNSDFLELKNSGKRHWPTKWLLFNYKKNNIGKIRFGVTLSRKVGKSVTRNRLKRWTRSYFRELSKSESFPEVDINVICKPMDKDFYEELSYKDFIKAIELGISFIKKSR